MSIYVCSIEGQNRTIPDTLSCLHVVGKPAFSRLPVVSIVSDLAFNWMCAGGRVEIVGECTWTLHYRGIIGRDPKIFWEFFFLGIIVIISKLAES